MKRAAGQPLEIKEKPRVENVVFVRRYHTFTLAKNKSLSSKTPSS
jgi:hypothetical protein